MALEKFDEMGNEVLDEYGIEHIGLGDMTFAMFCQFLEDYLPPLDPGHFQNAAARAFRVIDRGGKGRVTLGDLRAWAATAGTGITDDELELMFDAAADPETGTLDLTGYMALFGTGAEDLKNLVPSNTLLHEKGASRTAEVRAATGPPKASGSPRAANRSASKKNLADHGVLEVDPAVAMAAAKAALAAEIASG